MNAVPPSIRWVLLIAFALGSVVVVWFPQPPPHPRTIVADMGLSGWWWGREPSEDPPLYRTIEPELVGGYDPRRTINRGVDVPELYHRRHRRDNEHPCALRSRRRRGWGTIPWQGGGREPTTHEHI